MRVEYKDMWNRYKDKKGEKEEKIDTFLNVSILEASGITE
jgi:hypothetical protein